MGFRQWISSMISPEIQVNENFEAIAHVAVYANDAGATSGLTWGYYGGRWGGVVVADGTLALTNAATNYVVVNRGSGAISVSTVNTNWNDTNNYGRVYKLTTAGSLVTATEDHRSGIYGIHGQPDATGIDTTSVLAVAVGDEVTAITAGTGKVSYRAPYNFLITSIKASLVAAQASGGLLTVDVNKNGTSILSTKLTFDNTETTTKTAATAAVLSSSTLDDDDVITVDVDSIGASGAAGLKVYVIGKRTA